MDYKVTDKGIIVSEADLDLDETLDCGQAFRWKKTTTYTVLKRLCEKGIFQTVKGTVTSLMSRQDFYSVQSENFVNDTFDGSLPAFFAAFTARKQSR